MFELTNFNFENKPIRTALVNDEPFFVAKDVCDALGIANSRDAIKKLHPEDVGTTDTLTEGGPQKTNIVNESGLYLLIFQSRKPEAKAFTRWVTKEVLPSIRKTGTYTAEKFKQLENQLETTEYYLEIEQRNSSTLKRENEAITREYRQEIKQLRTGEPTEIMLMGLIARYALEINLRNHKIIWGSIWYHLEKDPSISMVKLKKQYGDDLTAIVKGGLLKRAYEHLHNYIGQRDWKTRF